MKKRTLTLLEIMIVILLITLITGAVGYSMRGTLNKGRAFRSEQAREQLHDLLLLSLAEEGATNAEIAANPEAYLSKLDLAKDPKKLVVDGWNEKFVITVKGKSDFNIVSERLNKYNQDRRKRFEKEPNSPQNEADEE